MKNEIDIMDIPIESDVLSGNTLSKIKENQC